MSQIKKYEILIHLHVKKAGEHRSCYHSITTVYRSRALLNEYGNCADYQLPCLYGACPAQTAGHANTFNWLFLLLYFCYKVMKMTLSLYRIDFSHVSRWLYICIKTTSICIETTCIETTLYQTDRKPFWGVRLGITWIWKIL